MFFSFVGQEKLQAAKVSSEDIARCGELHAVYRDFSLTVKFSRGTYRSY